MIKKIFLFLKEKNFAGNALLILFFILLRGSVFGNYIVPTGSMNPTILEGDKFFSNKLSYGFKMPFSEKYLISWNTPERGEIIAFNYPLDESVQFTKRVIGIPGDKIAVNNKYIYINGEKVLDIEAGINGNHIQFKEALGKTSYIIQHSMHYTMLDNVKELTVPEGCYFVMGDNRDNSSDSRVWGFVPIDNISGKILVRWMSFDSENFKIRFDRLGIVK
jgi:signal peptidase I